MGSTGGEVFHSDHPQAYDKSQVRAKVATISTDSNGDGSTTVTFDTWVDTSGQEYAFILSADADGDLYWSNVSASFGNKTTDVTLNISGSSTTSGSVTVTAVLVAERTDG